VDARVPGHDAAGGMVHARMIGMLAECIGGDA
jgi:hypothetical protein